MKQHELKPALGARRKRRRVGRGDGSGRGSYSGRGIKGQKARSGGGVRPGFEGGQLPLIKGLPSKRGFVNIFKKEYNVVNLRDLARLPAEAPIDPQVMAEAGLVPNLRRPIKVLGDGEAERALTVMAHRFSHSARQKIEAAGGVAQEIPFPKGP